MQQGYWIRNTVDLAPTDAVAMAVAAEEGGWDGVFVSDAVAENHSDPLTHLAAMAAVTSDVTLGTWVIPLPARDAVATARAAAVVDRLSGGRLLLGLGLGNESEHTALGVGRRDLGGRYDAAAAVLTELLAGATVTRHDRWFDLESVSLNVRPVQRPRPPVLCAVQSRNDAPLRRAVSYDGLMPFWPGFAEGRDPDVAEGAREAELRELLERYRALGGDGIVLVPRVERVGEEYDRLCEELGVAWQLTCDDLGLEDLRSGPPR